MTDGTSQLPNSLLQYLPAIYQQDAFIDQFLQAFEKLLLGRQDDQLFPPLKRNSVEVHFPQHGLEETIAGLAAYFDPQKTPDEFLPWLASWTAFSLRADLPSDKQRDFIANIFQLYRWRGTKQNLEKLLAIFVPHTDVSLSPPKVIETTDPPHFFLVTILLARTTPAVVFRQAAIARALIELEKPAHTYYKLDVLFPSMQVGVHSTVGVDTQLGAILT